jgi:hypothetical protein
MQREYIPNWVWIMRSRTNKLRLDLASAHHSGDPTAEHGLSRASYSAENHKQNNK